MGKHEKIEKKFRFRYLYYWTPLPPFVCMSLILKISKNLFFWPPSPPTTSVYVIYEWYLDETLGHVTSWTNSVDIWNKQKTYIQFFQGFIMSALKKGSHVLAPTHYLDFSPYDCEVFMFVKICSIDINVLKWSFFSNIAML